MMDPQLVIFAIESAVKLGRKIYDVLVDETVEGPLLLPVGELHANVQQNQALLFFAREENASLIKQGGPYFGFNPAQRLQAYQTLLSINDQLDVRADNLNQAADIVSQLHAFRQLKPGQGAKSPTQRILGTVFEIGVDYFVAHPEAMGKDSTARQVLHSFLQGLDDTDFAEGSATEIVGDVLGAALRTFEVNVDLVSDDKRVQVLLGGITKALVAEVDKAGDESEKLTAKRFIRRVASSVVRGGLGAFNENLNLFLPNDGTVKTLVDSTLSQVLGGIKDNEDLFTADTLEIVFKSALGAVGENAAIFTKNQFLQKLIARTVEVLTSTQASKLFTDATVSAILRETLEVVRENVETLIDPKNPREQLLASALSAMAQSLATNLAGGGDVKSLLSSRQLVDLVRVVFNEVAKHPEQLLDENLDDAKRTALAQIIGSVASALGDDPTRLVNGASFIELVRIALQVAVQNADNLLDLESAGLRSNVLFQALQQMAATILEQGDRRKIVSRDVFVEMVRRVLPIVSANIDLLAGKPVAETVRTALELASGALKARINGANLPILVEQLLRAVLSKELNLTEITAVELVARQILKAT
jgi:hypothetical protein